MVSNNYEVLSNIKLFFKKYFFHLISLVFTPSSNSVKLCEFLPSSIVNYY